MRKITYSIGVNVVGIPIYQTTIIDEKGSIKSYIHY